MVGLGETYDETRRRVRATCARTASRSSPSASTCARPSDHLPVVRYWHPEEFDALDDAGARDGLRSRRRRAARALELPRRRARAAGRPARAVAAPVARGAAGSECSRSRTTSRPTAPAVVTMVLIALNVVRVLRPAARRIHGVRQQPASRAGAPSRTSCRTTAASANSTAPARRSLCEGQSGVAGEPDAQPPAFVTAFTLDLHARQPPAPRRQHAVPVDLRQQRRGLRWAA